MFRLLLSLALVAPPTAEPSAELLANLELLMHLELLLDLDILTAPEAPPPASPKKSKKGKESDLTTHPPQKNVQPSVASPVGPKVPQDASEKGPSSGQSPTPRKAP